MSSASESFDYIIAGAGCAGLSLVVRMLSNEKLSSKRILIIDRQLKKQNDRTWCFWEKESGFFESIVHQRWASLHFHGPAVSRNLDIKPYTYKMIRSVDFYEHCRKIIAKHNNVQLLNGNVESFRSSQTGVVASVDGHSYDGRYGFNSTLDGIEIDAGKNILIKQHFKGWLIRTEENAFDPFVATLMDFRVPQSDGTSFFYVLPLAENRALVEYTLFTENLLNPEQYADGLHKYISQRLTQRPYEVLEEEQGVIPMTNYPFTPGEGNIFNIGTAGGQTKASTGYTFQFIQKHTEKIVGLLALTGSPAHNRSLSNRLFSLYDNVMLRVLHEKKHSGAELFTRIFSQGNPTSILRFLDNESSAAEDFAIMSRLPMVAFGAAAAGELLSRIGVR